MVCLQRVAGKHALRKRLQKPTLKLVLRARNFQREPGEDRQSDRAIGDGFRIERVGDMVGLAMPTGKASTIVLPIRSTIASARRRASPKVAGPAPERSFQVVPSCVRMEAWTVFRGEACQRVAHVAGAASPRIVHRAGQYFHDTLLAHLHTSVSTTIDRCRVAIAVCIHPRRPDRIFIYPHS